MRWAKRLWARLSEPRHLKVLYAIIYAIVLSTGIATLFEPPRSIEGQLGFTLTVIWSVFLVVGGFGGMLTVLPGWWWAERLSLILTLAGIGIYGTVVLSLHFLAGGSRLTQTGMVLLAASVFTVRWLLIRRYSFEPRKRE